MRAGGATSAPPACDIGSGAGGYACCTTPETANGVFRTQLFARVLPPGTTMLRAALKRRPTVVSVELGANEVLGATRGVAIPGVSMVPPSVWRPMYDALVDTVQMRVPRVVLVGLIRDAATFPSLRFGSEIWADAPTLLAAFHVKVLPDCNGSQNLIFVPVRIPTAIAIGSFYRSTGLPPYDFSCADGGTRVVDSVLTPAELGVVNSILNTMSADLRAGDPAVGGPERDTEENRGRPRGEVCPDDRDHTDGQSHARLAVVHLTGAGVAGRRRTQVVGHRAH